MIFSRKCPQCHSKRLKLSLDDMHSKRMRCPDCRCQFMYVAGTQWLALLMFYVFAALAVYSAVVFKSWLLFFMVWLVPSALIYYGLAKFGRLKLVGLRKHLKRKGVNIKAFVDKSKEITQRIKQNDD